MSHDGKVAIITGAGRNIGEAIAHRLAEESVAIAVVDLDQGRADKVVADLTGKGVSAAAFVCDVSSPEQIETTVNAIHAHFGRIDILVNNVAISDNKNILDIDLVTWQRTLDITLTAPFYFAKCVAHKMVSDQAAGNIVNVSSTTGYFGRGRAIAYAAAKGGVVNLTRAMAIQLADYNIRVNSVVPNKIGSPVGKDDFDPSRPIVNLRNRAGVPNDLANAVAFLVSDQSDFIVGTDLFVDGGCSVIMPGGSG
jgi:NAD(P)-dependent dehydrogenase (short-subunit alcohol dehydrogenase family)